MSLPAGHTFATMRPDEVATLVDWAADEQWNPGLHDVAVAHAFDPDGFVALRRGDELVGGGSILSYDGAFGFMGLFIVRPDLRGQGLGTQLWQHRRDRLRARLAPGATIGMDGVFAMAPFYEKGGFRLAYRDLRFEGTAPIGDEAALVGLREVGFEAFEAYDRRHSAVARPRFLREWVTAPGVHTVVAVEDGRIVGAACLRPCRRGHKFGPVHADTPLVAERLIRGLCNRVAGGFVQLDVPEPNTAGLALAAAMGWQEAFGCARMYHGPDPDLPVAHIYGVTSFEFG